MTEPVEGGICRHQIRVIFGDTDQMGVVYYGNYMRFFESARAAYWRGLGRSYQDLVDWGVAMPVVEAHCNYKRPALYEDLLVVETRVSEVRSASLRFAYLVKRGETGLETILAEGYTRHAVIDNAGKPRALPDALRAMIPPLA